MGAVPATVELLVTLVELSEMASLPEESCMALESLAQEVSVLGVGNYLIFDPFVVAKASSAVEDPDIAIAETLLIKPT